MQAKRKVSLFGSVRVLTMSAMLVATSVIIGIFCKTFLNFGMGLFRVTFENLPILAAGLMFGPVVGGLAGAATDIISYLLSPQVFPINPIVTLGAALIGAVAGLISRYIIKRPGRVRIIAACLPAHLVGSMVVKSVGLFQFYGWAILWRVPLYFVIAAIEITLLCLMYKNSKIRSLMDNFGGKHELR
jgi:ECF transporter S component (folate family)